MLFFLPSFHLLTPSVWAMNETAQNKNISSFFCCEQYCFLTSRLCSGGRGGLISLLMPPNKSSFDCPTFPSLFFSPARSFASPLVLSVPCSLSRQPSAPRQLSISGLYSFFFFLLLSILSLFFLCGLSAAMFERSNAKTECIVIIGMALMTAGRHDRLKSY